MTYVAPLGLLIEFIYYRAGFPRNSAGQATPQFTPQFCGATQDFALSGLVIGVNSLKNIPPTPLNKGGNKKIPTPQNCRAGIPLLSAISHRLSAKFI